MGATTKLKEAVATGEVAKICNVASRTISKCFGLGALNTYRIPRPQAVGASCSERFAAMFRWHASLCDICQSP